MFWPVKHVTATFNVEVSYSRVCGHVIGYRIRKTQGFYGTKIPSRDFNEAHVDGLASLIAAYPSQFLRCTYDSEQ